MSVRSQLKTARRLIRQRQYDTARALLQQIDHPTARRWLQQLEEREHLQPRRSEGLIAALIVAGGVLLIGALITLFQHLGWL
jgi:hypothetical protein